LIENHGVPVEIGESNEAIPVHFAYRRDMNIEVAASAGRKSPVDRPPLRDVFDTPDLAAMDDAIANGTRHGAKKDRRLPYRARSPSSINLPPPHVRRGSLALHDNRIVRGIETELVHW
jgi:hypothetical protein